MAGIKLYANNDGAKAEVVKMYLGSSKVVRLQRGMQVLYEDWPTCTIEATAGHTTGITPATLLYGKPWSVVFIADPGYAVDTVEVLMGGVDITSEVYSDGVISIPRVTGNVVITVETASVTNTNMFTKRTTGDGITILNDKALLKGIRGNTLVWRQFWSTANASTNSSICSLSHTDEELVLTATGNSSSTSAKLNAYIGNLGITGHIFYVRAEVYIETTTTVENGHFGMGWVTGNSTTSGGNTNRPKNEWFTVELRTEIASAKMLMLAGVNGNKWLGNGSNKIRVKNLIVADLTAMFGAGNEPAAEVFSKLFPSQYYAYNSSASAKSNCMTNYVSKDEDEETLQNVALDVTTLTGKLNGSGESVTIFANGMKSSCNEAVNDTYDEIKKVNGVWKAFKRCGDTWESGNQISGKGEWNILSTEEVYVLDNQTIPTELTVGNGGTEEILPTTGSTPTTAPAIMEIQYGAIPSRGLLGGDLSKGGGGDDEPTDGEEIDNGEELLDEPIEDELKEDEKDEPKEPIIEEKEQLKK